MVVSKQLTYFYYFIRLVLFIVCLVHNWKTCKNNTVICSVNAMSKSHFRQFQLEAARFDLKLQSFSAALEYLIVAIPAEVIFEYRFEIMIANASISILMFLKVGNIFLLSSSLKMFLFSST